MKRRDGRKVNEEYMHEDKGPAQENLEHIKL
jgi:hypothetical protein